MWSSDFVKIKETKYNTFRSINKVLIWMLLIIISSIIESLFQPLSYVKLTKNGLAPSSCCCHPKFWLIYFFLLFYLFVACHQIIIGKRPKISLNYWKWYTINLIHLLVSKYPPRLPIGSQIHSSPTFGSNFSYFISGVTYKIIK